ncbi:hypothetical protein HMPREF0083_04803 [Aneurinibacillus aneurinilyticus ATCC 12856]|uniref:Uncharacterized protein n=1 Tax=Aneurinibacillus aneurinilyticus ATCC 12856 TaxID=649747 RepID=U1WWQ9_ANEAE|nr:hypothetical protein HMPREF0083_04803 [Aneurinibacillus aneurinilyticus ATCC 12856]
MVGRRRFGKRQRVDAPCAPAEKRLTCLFPPAPATNMCRFIQSDVYN